MISEFGGLSATPVTNRMKEGWKRMRWAAAFSLTSSFYTIQVIFTAPVHCC